ncbi:tRNA (guanine(26)-N(2))-dimethyltransferase 1-like protein, partial [Drosera capensis]
MHKAAHLISLLERKLLPTITFPLSPLSNFSSFTQKPNSQHQKSKTQKEFEQKSEIERELSEMGGGINGVEENNNDTQMKKEETTVPVDVNEFVIIKEGEAEILMHTKNKVFYNKTQVVNNRDLSIAVLRAFISKRKEEHEAWLSRKVKTEKVLVENSSEPATEDEHSESANRTEGSNGEPEFAGDMCEDGPSITLEESISTPEVKPQRELKPPRVLEALSASGLRALRYAREVKGIGQVVALDIDK